MTNCEIYSLFDSLGMIDDSEAEKCCYPADEPQLEPAAEFDEKTQDLVYVMNFVNSLMALNDQTTLEKFLVALIYNNHKRGN